MPEGTDDNKPKFRIIESTPDREARSTEDATHAPGVNDEAIQLKVSQLEQEHRDLDQAIATMEERMPYDRLTLQRMKKRKLALKDKITTLSGSVLPDIIA